MMRPGEIIVDSFAGGGGASLGITWALGRGPDIAINHDREAIALHAANHPESRHYAEDVWKVDPVAACAGRPVGLMWLSPDCKHFSKAKGGKPVSKRVRGLAWVAVRWAQAVKPRIIVLENVEEFQTWGPVLDSGKPCPERKGRTFKAFCTRLRRLGYEVQWRELRACDYGTPTIRKRLFLIARCDGAPIVWPKPTHGKGLIPWRTAGECIDWSIHCPSIFARSKPLAENTLKRIARGLRRFVIESAHPFIVPMQHQNRPTAMNEPLQTVTTQGNKFNLVTPYIVPLTHHGDSRIHSLEEPAPTVTGAHRGEHALVMPYIAGVGGRAGQSPERPVDKPYQTITAKADAVLVAPMLVQTAHGEFTKSGKKRGKGEHQIDAPMGTVLASGNHALVAPVLVSRYGEAKGQAPRARPVDLPLPTVVPTSNGASLVSAFLAKHYGDRGQRPGSGMDEPVSTVTACDHNALVASHIMKLKGTSKDGQPMTAPLHTVQASGLHYAEVRSFLVAYYGNEKHGGELSDPMRTITSRERFGLVTVDGQDYAIADIGMRMLAARELYRAQGFPDSYRIDVEFNGKPLTKTAQVRMCGNSVCPPLAAAIVRANIGDVERAGVAA